MEIEKLLIEKRDEIMALAARHGALNPRVFGSAARGESGSESDIDLLVKMEEGRSLLDVSALMLELQDLRGVPAASPINPLAGTGRFPRCFGSPV